jgi:hypothetical protein
LLILCEAAGDGPLQANRLRLGDAEVVAIDPTRSYRESGGDQ